MSAIERSGHLPTRVQSLLLDHTDRSLPEFGAVQRKKLSSHFEILVDPAAG